MKSSGGEDGRDGEGNGDRIRAVVGVRCGVRVAYRDDDGDDVVGGRGVGGEAELKAHGIKEGCLEAGVGVGECAPHVAEGDGGLDLG